MLGGQHIERPTRARSCATVLKPLRPFEPARHLVVIPADDGNGRQVAQAVDDGIRIGAISNEISEHQGLVVSPGGGVGEARLEASRLAWMSVRTR